MADAFLIETRGETAGIVVMEQCGFRFFASEPAFYPLDGKIFESISAVHSAVRHVRRGPIFNSSSERQLQPAPKARAVAA